MRATLFKLWWFRLRSLPTRLRFRRGRASFVECSVAGTESELTSVLDAAGRALGPRLLARHRLTCRPPRLGPSGWALYEERLLEPGPHRFAALECANCLHLYVIQVQSARPDLSSPDGRPLAASVDFQSDWFQFAPSEFDGPSTLNCPRCEEKVRPAVAHLHEPS